MTINEHDRVSTGRDDESGAHQSSSRPCRSSERRRALRRRLRRPGQRLAGDPGGTGVLGRYRVRAERRWSARPSCCCEPVARELIVVRPIGFEPMQWVRALAAEEAVPTAKHLTSAAVSVPGVLLTQIAAMRALSRQGLDLTATPPVAVAGHSQGVLAVRGARRQGRQGRRAAGAGCS